MFCWLYCSFLLAGAAWGFNFCGPKFEPRGNIIALPVCVMLDVVSVIYGAMRAISASRVRLVGSSLSWCSGGVEKRALLGRVQTFGLVALSLGAHV